ncbi:AI-2E family transporter [Candidatus Saccharibacteria bacterium]|nr:AI-2E family transporter [Candidatus Saccharibacteria bacterium]
MNLTLRIETKTIVRVLLTVTLFGLGIYFLTKIASALTIFAVAAFLALALNPPVTRLANILPGHSRILATAIAYVVVLTILGSLLYVAAPPVYQQTNDFVRNIPNHITELTANNSALARVIDQYDLQDEVAQFVNKAREESGSIAQGVGTSLVSGVSNFMSGTVTMLMILVLTFLMLIEGPSWIRRLWELYNDKRRLARDQRLVRQMYKVVSNYVTGQFLVATINAAGVLVVLFILSQIFDAVSLNIILPITGIIFVAALIPMFGATIGAIIATFALILSSIPAALIFLGYYIIYQQIENNVIQPVVQARTIQLTALMVFTAAILGILALGIIGAVMAIPIAGCLRVLAVDFLTHRDDYFHKDHRHDGKKAALVVK